MVSRNLGQKPNLGQETLTLWGLALRGEQDTAITFECNVRPEVQYVFCVLSTTKCLLGFPCNFTIACLTVLSTLSSSSNDQQLISVNCKCMDFDLSLLFQDLVLSHDEGSSPIDDALLEGHIGITRELLLFQSSQKKFEIGSQKDGPNLIKVK